MFERYTEKARRVIFFARYEASQHGSYVVGPEHLLLGALREHRGLMAAWLDPAQLDKDLRAAMQPAAEKLSTSVDLPLSHPARRILAYAAEEAERLEHKIIDTQHLIAGMLLEQNTVAAQTLLQHGVTIERLRVQLSPIANNETIVGALRKTFAPMASRLTPEDEPAVTFFPKSGTAE